MIGTVTIAASIVFVDLSLLLSGLVIGFVGMIVSSLIDEVGGAVLLEWSDL
jgi:hypothetical protein